VADFDQADIILALPTDKLVQTLHTLDANKRERLESVLSYSEDTAGGLMNLDQVTVRADVSLDVVLRYLRIRGELPDHTDQLFVTDRHDHYLGALYLRDLLTNDLDVEVKSIMRTDVDAMHVHMSDNEVAREFEKYDLVSAAIVDEEHRLIGRITIDDVVDVIRDEAEHSLMSAAGLDEEDDMFAPVFKSARRRALWLGINLCTAFLANVLNNQGSVDCADNRSQAVNSMVMDLCKRPESVLHQVDILLTLLVLQLGLLHLK